MAVSFEDPRNLLKRYGLQPKRSWGQNFIVSRRAIEAIARLCVDRPDLHVIEIGAGLGTLTRALIDLGACVTAVERETDMCSVLRAEFAQTERFRLEEADAAEFDYGDCLAQRHGVITGNLPYQLTGPILRRISERAWPLVKAVFMVQLEVADRLAANPGTRIRGALSVMIQARYKTRIALRLPPSAFHPQPKVRSAVIELIPLEISPIEGLDPGFFDAFVKAAFSSRRKMLRNSLFNAGFGSQAELIDLFEKAKIDSRRRAEHLTNEEFVALAGLAADAKSQSSLLPPISPSRIK
jgi:16S rRNA (adenine1518-N6/adenine1519-N6)-dimethyltransferase